MYHVNVFENEIEVIGRNKDDVVNFRWKSDIRHKELLKFINTDMSNLVNFTHSYFESGQALKDLYEGMIQLHPLMKFLGPKYILDDLWQYQKKRLLYWINGRMEMFEGRQLEILIQEIFHERVEPILKLQFQTEYLNLNLGEELKYSMDMRDNECKEFVKAFLEGLKESATEIGVIHSEDERNEMRLRPATMNKLLKIQARLRFVFDTVLAPKTDYLKKIGTVQRYELFLWENKSIAHLRKKIKQSCFLPAQYRPSRKVKSIVEPDEEDKMEIQKFLQSKSPTQALPRGTYTVRGVEDILFIELDQMVMAQTKVVRCRNCGNLFIPTKRNKAYCDEPIRGENGKTCRDVGPTNAFNKKVDNDPVYQEYQREYRRHYGQFNRGSIEEEELKKWKKPAMDAWQKYKDGELSEEEFLAFIGRDVSE